MTGRQEQPSSQRFRGDLALFVVAAFAGATAIVTLKSLGLPQWIVTALPVAIILVYAGPVGFVRYFRLRADRAGDSCYYLGFLFTLVSLGVSLFHFRLDEGQIEILITNFGIALGTTIVGMALRVVFAQFRDDPVEIEREVRAELGEAVSRFRAELDNAVSELGSYRRATQQAFTEAIADLFEQHRDGLARHVAAVEDSFVGAAERFAEGAVKLAERTQSINQQTGRLAKRLEALVARIDAVEVAPDAMTRRIEPFAAVLERLGQTLENQGKAEERRALRLEVLMDRTSRSMERVVAGAEAMAGLAPALQAVEERLAAGGRGLGDLEGRIRAFDQAMKEHGSVVTAALRDEADARDRHREAIARIGDETLVAVREHNDRLRRELDVERDLVAKVESGLVRLVDELAERVAAGPAPRPNGVDDHAASARSA